MTQNAMFPGFEDLGDAVEYAHKIRQVVGHNALFDDFSVDDLKQLGPYMHVYRAPAHGILISEGERGDFMAFTIDGLIDVTKKDRWDVIKRIAVVQAGSALGEMSMIDGEARFASCAAIEPTTFAVLTRSNLQELITKEPRLASKILMKLVYMLSQRLRQTSAKLVNYLEK